MSARSYKSTGSRQKICFSLIHPLYHNFLLLKTSASLFRKITKLEGLGRLVHKSTHEMYRYSSADWRAPACSDNGHVDRGARGTRGHFRRLTQTQKFSLTRMGSNSPSNNPQLSSQAWSTDVSTGGWVLRFPTLTFPVSVSLVFAHFRHQDY